MIELVSVESCSPVEGIKEVSDRFAEALVALTRREVRNARREERGNLNDYLNTLASLVSDYTYLPDAICERRNLDDIIRALLAENGENLKKVAGLRGGGELFGIKKNGTALFKDFGTQPIIYGYGKDGGLIQMDEYSPEQLRKMVRPGNYHDVRRCVHASGYELFYDQEKGGEDEIRMCEELTDEPLVRNAARDNQNVGTWLESGEKPEKAGFAYFNTLSKKVVLGMDYAIQHGYDRGAIRVFRMA
jgi:hypothetical protein